MAEVPVSAMLQYIYRTGGAAVTFAADAEVVDAQTPAFAEPPVQAGLAHKVPVTQSESILEVDVDPQCSGYSKRWSWVITTSGR